MAKQKEAAPPAAKTEVVPAKSTAVATLSAEESRALALMGDSPGGLEDISRADIAIPFLGILQALSPQLEPGNAKYIEEAKIGRIIQTVTGELMTHAVVVPVDYKRTFVEWVPRSEGGGFRGEYGMEREEEFEKLIDRSTGIAVLENGNHLIDTRNFYVLAGSSFETLEPMIISMSRTQTKKAKTFVALIQNYIPLGAPPRRYPAWAAVYDFSTVLEKNEKGSWYGWNIRRAGMNTNEALIGLCAKFREQIRGGIVTINREEDVGGAGSVETGAM